jgi:lactoylglutathione lyase
VLELTWNHGTEADETFKYYSGNESRGEPASCSDGRGFGHIGFVVDDVAAACASLEPLGYGFKKRLGEGGMKDIAFAFDPDGYWVEIVPKNLDLSAFL